MLVAGGPAPSPVSFRTAKTSVWSRLTSRPPSWQRTPQPMRRSSPTSRIGFPLRTPKPTWWFRVRCSNTSRTLSALLTRCKESFGPKVCPYTCYLAVTHFLPSWRAFCRSGSQRVCYTGLFRTHVASWSLTSTMIAATPLLSSVCFVTLAFEMWRSNVRGIKQRTFTRSFPSSSSFLPTSALPKRCRREFSPHILSSAPSAKVYLTALATIRPMPATNGYCFSRGTRTLNSNRMPGRRTRRR